MYSQSGGDQRGRERRAISDHASPIRFPALERQRRLHSNGSNDLANAVRDRNLKGCPQVRRRPGSKSILLPWGPATRKSLGAGRGARVANENSDSFSGGPAISCSRVPRFFWTPNRGRFERAESPYRPSPGRASRVARIVESTIPTVARSPCTPPSMRIRNEGSPSRTISS